MPAGRRSMLPRRSRVAWGMRAVLALAAAWLGWISVTHSLAAALRTNAPMRAYALAPDDAQVAGLYSATLSGADASLQERARADAIAWNAIRRDPTVVTAVATLGINAAIREDAAAARRLFAYSELLSRRDLRTRLWAIEDAVARDDVPRVLRNYDIALRTSRIAPDILFPVLMTAISDPQIRTALIRTMAARPAWNDPFIFHASSNRPDVGALASLLQGLAQAQVPVPDWASVNVVERLLAEGDDTGAWAYYASTRPGIDRRTSRDPGFGKLAQPAPFDWVVVAEPGISATMQRAGEGGVFDFSAPPSMGGVLLRQRQMLPPGRYVLEGRSAELDQPEAARPYWLLACADGRELGRLTLPNSSTNNGRFSGSFEVPATCAAQVLSLVARPSDQFAGLSGQIGRALLRPAE